MRAARLAAVLGGLAAALAANGAAAGFFTVTQTGGAWWFLDGAGRPFLCRAPNVVEIGPKPADLKPDNPAYCGLAHYPTEDGWADAIAARLRSWGFNAIGGYSDHAVFAKRGLPYTVALVMGGMYGVPWLDPRAPDNLKATEGTVATARALRDDPLLIGYFVDNELGWYDESVFTFWLQQPGTARVKRELVAMLKAEYHGDLRALAAEIVLEPAPKSWKDLSREFTTVAWAPGRRPLVADRFVEWLAAEYYGTVAAALRAADPHHLLLGDRYASFYSQPVVRAAGRFMDVVSANYNGFARSGWVSPAFFDGLYRLSHRPLLIGEYYCSAMENASGDLNRNGPFLTVQTQAERAAAARTMTESFARLPYLVGWHWFQFADEPPQGRGDGEDFNFGLVDIHDRPYPGLVDGFTAAHARAEALHRAGPGPDGLVEAGGEWRVPRAAWTVSVDGSLDEWNLPASWAPGAEARAPFVPFGDVYLAWTPEGLLVGAAFRDFASGGRPQDEADPASGARLSVLVQRAGAPDLLVDVTGLYARVGAPPPEPAKGEKKADDTRPWAPLAGPGGVRGGQTHNSLEAVAEVLVPAAALGGTPLASGEALTLAVSIRLRGDVKETWWGAALSGGAPAAEAAAAVRLVAAAR